MYEINLDFEITADHRRKRRSSQEGEKGKETGDIRQREWKHKPGRREDLITFSAQRTSVLTDQSYSGSTDYSYVLSMSM